MADYPGMLSPTQIESKTETPFPNTELYEKDVLLCIAGWKKISEEYVAPKRQKFRDYYRLYNNQRKHKRKVAITSVYTMMSALLAVSYTDEQTVAFGPADIRDEDAIDRWTKLSKHDNFEMRMNLIQYIVKWNRLFYGVGIRVMNEWNNVTKTPIPRTRDPFTWLPDPNGDGIMNEFRFHGFEVEATKDQLTEGRGFYNVDKLSAPSLPNSDIVAIRQARNEAAGLQNIDAYGQKDGDCHHLIDWYCKYEGKVWFFVTDSDCKTLVKAVEIKPKTPQEMEYPELVKLPIVLNYYSPVPGDPFGISVPDLTEDKQRAKSILANLRIAVERSRLYPMYLYDKTRILNRRDLDFGFNKLVGVNGPVDNGLVEPIVRDLKSLGQTVNMEASLEEESEKATGSGPIQQGVLSSTSRTLGEIQQAQSNANLRFALAATIDSWGEEFFWERYMYVYWANFDSAQQKLVEITTPVGSTYLTVTKKDLTLNASPRIRIISKLQQRAELERERTEFAAIIPMVQSDPMTPDVSKRYARRRLFKLYNLSPDEIDIMVPKSPDEINAERENILLQNAHQVDIQPDDDHLSHIVIHGKLEKTAEVIAHMEAHYLAYVQLGDKQKMQEQAMALASDQKALAAQGQSQVSASAANQPRSASNVPTMAPA